MRHFLFYLLILVIAVWLGITIAYDPGYLLLSYRDWTMEMPLWFALGANLVLFILFYVALNFWQRLATWPIRRRYKIQRRRQQKAEYLMEQAFQSIITGNWLRTQNKLLQAARFAPKPWLQYLAAAFTAQQLKQKEQRDLFLQKAAAITPVAAIGASLLRASFDRFQSPEQALTVLKKLQQREPKQPMILKWLTDVYKTLSDWPGLLSLLPVLQKEKTFSAPEIRSLEQQCYCGLLADASKVNLATLQELWQKMPRDLHNDLVIIRCYCYLLILHDAPDQAEYMLRKTLEKKWDTALLQLYGSLISHNADRQLAYAEKWIAHHKHDAELLLILGQLCMRCQLWGKARNYFEASLAIRPSITTSLELAKLLERLGENPTAILNAYKNALELLAEQKQKELGLSIAEKLD